MRCDVNPCVAAQQGSGFRLWVEPLHTGVWHRHDKHYAAMRRRGLWA